LERRELFVFFGLADVFFSNSTNHAAALSSATTKELNTSPRTLATLDDRCARPRPSHLATALHAEETSIVAVGSDCYSGL
jgi:hypothetical protein